jgi:hypothetical protein
MSACRFSFGVKDIRSAGGFDVVCDKCGRTGYPTPQIHKAGGRIGTKGGTAQTTWRRAKRNPARRLRHMNQVLSE